MGMVQVISCFRQKWMVPSILPCLFSLPCPQPSNRFRQHPVVEGISSPLDTVSRNQ
jgi:hypothetical protein